MAIEFSPAKAFVFRITHRDNIDRVLAGGCPCRTQIVGQTGYTEIGNQELIQRRSGRVVPCSPGGTLSDYVPFYFTPYTPMLYNIKTGRGVPKKPMKDVMILVSSLHYFVKNAVPFVFTDRHAYLKAAQFSSDLADLDRIIWPTLQRRDFKKDDADKFEKYQAEALAYHHVPTTALLGIACYDDGARVSVQNLADKHGNTVKIVARAEWYL
jgi:hypothetical protein